MVRQEFYALHTQLSHRPFTGTARHIRCVRTDGSMSPSCSARQLLFPTELVSLVLEQLRADRATLKSCTLVCKSWTYLAHAHLFRTATITSEVNLHEHAALFQSAPHIALHVRVICIKPSEQNPVAPTSVPVGKGKGRRDSQTQLWVTSVAEVLAPMLPSVRALHLSRVSEDLVPLNASFTKPLASLRVRELKLTGCNFRRFATFERIVRAFPALKTLALDMVSWQPVPVAKCPTNESQSGSSEVTQPKKSITTIPALEVLRIGRFCHLPSIVRWLCTAQELPVVKALYLNDVPADHLQSASLLLNRLGASLEHLTLGCRFERYEHTQFSLNDYFSLPTTTSLRSFHLRILDLTRDKMLWVPILLEDPPFPSLRELKFDIWLWRPQQLANEYWNRVETALNAPAYIGLDSVVFVQRGHVDWQGPLDYEGARRALSMRFPRLDERGILRVVDGKEVCE